MIVAEDTTIARDAELERKTGDGEFLKDAVSAESGSTALVEKGIHRSRVV